MRYLTCSYALQQLYPGRGLGQAGRAGFVALLLVLTSALRPASGVVAPLALHAAPLPFTPQEFYVAAVLDERPHHPPVASLQLPTAQPRGTDQPQPVDLQGGTEAALRQFVRQSWVPNPALRPLTIRVQECRVQETLVPGSPGLVAGTITVVMAFEWQRAGQTIPLTTYRGTARYQRPRQQLAVVEPALRQALTQALRYLNTWMSQQASRNEKLAYGVRVSFADYTQNTDADTLFYDPGRPLTFADFLGAPREGKYAATVFPSFAFGGKPQLKQGWLQVELVVKVFVVRHSSWVSAGGRDAYNLNHEQRHFDLVKLVAERFKRTIQAAPLTPDEYNGTIQWAYLDAFREMNRVQDQYDGETYGGLNHEAQERWNHQIDAELRALAGPR